MPGDDRASAARIEHDARVLRESPVIRALLECVNGALLVLNDQRQIVASAGLDRLGLDERDAANLLGARPGEALGCEHAQGPGGCGSSEACRACGALGAIQTCQRTGRPVERELLTTLRNDRPLELSVRATPVTAAGTRWTALAMRDISAERRRESLENVFLHDLLNTFSGLAGWTHLLRRAGPDEWPRISERVSRLVQEMESELREQRALLAAEDGSLQLQPVRVKLAPLLEEISATLSQSAAGAGRQVAFGPPPPRAASPDVELHCDRTLLRRVLLNMMKNALEATPPSGTIHVWGERSGGDVEIHVWNPGFIPPAVGQRIFQRSFSTKRGRGRGLGTYSMRLLGERYLGGEVSFTSTPSSGTTFTLRLSTGP